MNSRAQNLLIIPILVSMESSHLVIFSTSGKFITKFNVLRCISLSETLFWTGARGRITITLKDQKVRIICRPKGGILILQASRMSSWSGVFCVAGRDVNF